MSACSSGSDGRAADRGRTQKYSKKSRDASFNNLTQRGPTKPIKDRRTDQTTHRHVPEFVSLRKVKGSSSAVTSF